MGTNDQGAWRRRWAAVVVLAPLTGGGCFSPQFVPPADDPTSGTSVGDDTGNTSSPSSNSASSSPPDSTTSGPMPSSDDGASSSSSTTTDEDTSSSSGVPSICDGRWTTDRPDDTDLPQVHAVYVLSSDAVDYEFDLDGTIASSLTAAAAWMSSVAEGRSLRLDTCEGELDVSFVRLDRTEAELAAAGNFLRDELELELATLGFDGYAGNGKLLAVYYSGGDNGLSCGSGAFPPQLVGTVGALFLGTTFPAPTPDCLAGGFATANEAPHYLEFSLLQALMHTLGAVAGCAPNSNGANTGDLPSDLMYAGPEPWVPSEVDPGRDDYFDHGTDCLDIARSAFLDPSPPDPQLPPGWPPR